MDRKALEREFIQSIVKLAQSREKIFHHVVDPVFLGKSRGLVVTQCFRWWAKVHRHVDEIFKSGQFLQKQSF